MMERKLKPMAFCLQTLTDTEKRYAQAEKDCLTRERASKHFYQYLYGLKKYKPLVGYKQFVTLNNSKDLNTSPIHSQHLNFINLMSNLLAEYVPGKHLVAADTLSRHPVEYWNQVTWRLKQM